MDSYLSVVSCLNPYLMASTFLAVYFHARKNFPLSTYINKF